MNDSTAEKFASLLATCATTGKSDELRKEAAAQNLLKTAMTPQEKLLWALGGSAVGAGIGGAAGYFSNTDEKKKKRDALYGALSGGLLGLGVPLIGIGSDAVAQATDKINTANNTLKSDVAKATKPATGATPDGKRTWGNFAYSWLPGTSKETVFDDPKHPYHSINPGNVSGRLVGGLSGGLGGYLSGAAVDSARTGIAQSRANAQHERGVQRAMLNDLLTNTGGGKTRDAFQVGAADLLREIRQAPRGTIGQRIVDYFSRVAENGPRGAAAKAVGLTPYTGGRFEQLASFLPRFLSRRLPVIDQSSLEAFHNKRRYVRALVETAQNRAVGRSARAVDNFAGGVSAAAANPSRPQPTGRGGRPLPTSSRSFNSLREALGVNLPRGEAPLRPDGSAIKLPKRPEVARRSGGRKIGGPSGALIGTLAAHPYFAEQFLNWLHGSQLVDPPPAAAGK